MQFTVDFFRGRALMGAGMLLAAAVVLPCRADNPAPSSAGTNMPAPAHAQGTNAAAPAVVAPEVAEQLRAAAYTQRMQEFRQASFDRLPLSLLQAQQQRDIGLPAPTNEIALLQWQVTLHDWPGVAQVFAAWPLAVSTQLYTEFIRLVQRPPQPRERPPEEQFDPSPSQRGENQQQQQQRPVWFWSDVLGLADAAPCALQPEQLLVLGRLLQRTLLNEEALSNCVTVLEQGTRRLGGTVAAQRRAAGDLLAAADQCAAALAFLPAVPAALAANDARGVAVHIQTLVAQAVRTQDPAAFQAAWRLAYWALTNAGAAVNDRVACLSAVLPPPAAFTGMVSFACWMDELATNVARGSLFLNALALAAQKVSVGYDTTQRCALLALNARVLDAMAAAPWRHEPARQHALAFLALDWLREAEQTIGTYRRPQLRARNYSPYYYNYRREEPQQSYGQMPLTPAEALATMPDHAAEMACDPALAARLDDARIRLCIKDAAYTSALARIAALPWQSTARTRTLATELLLDWQKNRKPSPDAQNEENYYYGPYGQQRPPGIPLTRAMQARNLAEFARMYPALCRAGVSTAALIQAFCDAHSDAEVFHVRDITNGFGPFAAMTADVLAEFAQQMRRRLAAQWREPQMQQQSGTKRTDKDIQAEVLRGYGLLTNLLVTGLHLHPDAWQLSMHYGATMFDWAEYDYGRDVEVNVYNAMRRAAFDAFARAAALYAAQVPRLPQSAWLATPYLQWFTAALGASDAAYLTRQREPSTQQLDDVRAALEALPAPAVAAHRAAFARALTGAIAGLKPEFKARYLRAALRIIGDDPGADTIRAMVAYYDGLLNDLALLVRLDGSACVGHTQEFGALLVLQHTGALEREAGGFSKYLRNMRSGGGNYYYYGEEPVDYRDNLEKHIREALDRSFFIGSITFSDANVKSRGCARPDWRETPLAYMVLTAKDAAADQLPAIQMDLDFLDMDSKVLLPIETPILPIDARTQAPPPRPVTNLLITCLLDERAAREGAFALEINASGLGLIPALPQLITPRVPGFVVESISDSGTRVKELDTASNETTMVVCDRTWMLRLKPEPGARRPPAVFRFPACDWPGARIVYQRYVDADIVPVAEAVALAGVHLRRAWWLLWLALPVLVFAAGVVALVVWCARARRRAVAPVNGALQMPAHLTPFSVLRLLQQIASAAGTRLGPDDRGALNADIAAVQAAYFEPPAGAPAVLETAALEQCARRWVCAANAAEKTR